MNFRAIVFDMDGTIADTIPLTLYALKEAVRELTGKVYSDEEIRAEFGPTDTEIVRKLVDNENREASPEIYIDIDKVILTEL
jgi:phosphoglycolate phosphatase/pyrophosphatase PpaX